MIKTNFNANINKKRAAEILAEIRADAMGGWIELPAKMTITANHKAAAEPPEPATTSAAAEPPELTTTSAKVKTSELTTTSAETKTPELAAIKAAAQKIQSESKYLVCIGIGGSYLGHRAIIEALAPVSALISEPQQPDAQSGTQPIIQPDTPQSGTQPSIQSGTQPDAQSGTQPIPPSPVKIIYAGNSLSRRELDRALAAVGEADFSINVISKSGTTLEPAIAFTEFKQKLIDKYGETAAAQRIYATTDAHQGTLHDEAVAKGYTRFVVPDDIGGRYSVLSAVGLLPLAAAGIDIDALLAGAREMMSDEGIATAVNYAYMRHALGQKGYDTEVFASFEPATLYFNEWLKQLFGESEGKDKQGIFPASVIYSTDLHSLGQFMQDGRRSLWETIIDYPTDDLNRKVVKAVQIAHVAGGIPVLTLTVPSYDEHGFGQLVYFFELACAISAKLFGVNPFDQPGVEAYKKELKSLLSN